MSTLTQRKVNSPDDDVNKKAAAAAAAAPVSEEEMEPLPSCPSGEGLPQDTDQVFDSLKEMSPRWRNWMIRGFFTCLMLGGFVFMIYLGDYLLYLIIF